MKIYGAEKNRETITCKYGCCGGVISKPRKGSAFSKAVAKARRKSARRWKNKQYFKDEKEVTLVKLNHET